MRRAPVLKGIRLTNSSQDECVLFSGYFPSPDASRPKRTRTDEEKKRDKDPALVRSFRYITTYHFESLLFTDADFEIARGDADFRVYVLCGNLHPWMDLAGIDGAAGHDLLSRVRTVARLAV